jgi:hypothetical protein
MDFNLAAVQDTEIQGGCYMEEHDHRKKLTTKRIILILEAAIVVIGGGIGAGLLRASEKPSFCKYCHIMVPYYNSWKDSDLLAHKHEKANVTCHECHQESIPEKINEGVKYVTGDYQNPLPKENYGTRAFCLKCHNFNEVKSKTNFAESNPHDSHNGEQECNVCHNMHRQSRVMCVDCHIFKWMNNLDKSWKSI